MLRDTGPMMRPILGFVLLSAAFAGALTPNVREEHHAFLKGREATLQNISATNGSTQAAEIISGMYLVEFADGHVSSDLHKANGILLTLVQDNTSFYASLHTNGIMTTARMGLNYSLFQGASFRINDFARENNHASRIAAMPAVKQMWPLRNYSIPDIQHKNVMFNPNGTITSIEDPTIMEADASSRKDTYSTHVMTQVDRLRAEGSMSIFPLSNRCLSLLDMSCKGGNGIHALTFLLIKIEQSLVMVSA